MALLEAKLQGCSCRLRAVRCFGSQICARVCGAGFGVRSGGRLSKSRRSVSKAVEIDDDSCAQCGLGMVYHRQGKDELAEAALKKSQVLNPKDTCAFNQLGRMYYALETYP